MAEFLNSIAEWAEEHPYITMFFIEIPLCITASTVTTLLLM